MIVGWFIKRDRNSAKALAPARALTHAKTSANNEQNQIKLPDPSPAVFDYPFLGITTFFSKIFVTPGRVLGQALGQAFVCRRAARVKKLVSNVHYIDTVNSNYLFRGALPVTGNPPVFNYDGLKKAIVNAAKRAGVKVPASFYIIDLNLLNIENPADAHRITAEQEFFQKNPRLGRVQVWGMSGIGLDVTDPALAANREYLAQNLDKWLKDKLTSRVEILRKMLEGNAPDFRVPTNQPIVIFMHCVAGCDRTGELSGAYYLRYQNKTWEEVNTLNQSMCRRHRPFGCKNYRALQWYCLWLNLQRGYALNWRQDFSCSGKQVKLPTEAGNPPQNNGKI